MTSMKVDRKPYRKQMTYTCLASQFCTELGPAQPQLVSTIVIDIHEDEVVTTDIENIETHMSEEVVVSDIIEDTFTEYLAFKCKMSDFASARKADLKNHKKTIHH